MWGLYKIEKRNPDGSWETVLDNRTNLAGAKALIESAAARGNTIRLVEKSTGKILWQV